MESFFREQELTAPKFVLALESMCREQESIGKTKNCVIVKGFGVLLFGLYGLKIRHAIWTKAGKLFVLA